MRNLIRSLVLVLGLLFSSTVSAAAPLVLAAASLQESLTAVAQAWAARGHALPVISFAASSALARQIDAGAPADLFISADEQWMDHVADRGLIVPNARVSFLTNRLVLIAPANSRVPITIRRGFRLDRALGDGRLAVADPDSVPAGRYAKDALIRLGAWSAVEPKLARAENVRAALAFVERGEAPLGIVYATDAKASTKVRIVGFFPEGSHLPISYSVALLKTATSADAEAFRRFLLSPDAKSIFRRFGFLTR